jgi:hypothetical protein
MYSLISQNLESFIEVLEDAEVVMLSKRIKNYYTPKFQSWNAFRILTENFSSQSGTINGQSEFIR